MDEIYSSPPKKKFPTNRLLYNIFDEIWSIDLAEFSYYKISNSNGFRNIFVIIDIFSKYTRCVRLKNKYGDTIKKRIFKNSNNIQTQACYNRIRSRSRIL